MKYLTAVVIFLLVCVSVPAQRLTAQDWTEMDLEQKELFLRGYVDGRVSEISNVVVLGLRLTVGGAPVVNNRITGQFIDHVDSKTAYWTTINIADFVVAVDRSIEDNPSMINDALFLFVGDALLNNMGYR